MHHIREVGIVLLLQYTVVRLKNRFDLVVVLLDFDLELTWFSRGVPILRRTDRTVVHA